MNYIKNDKTDYSVRRKENGKKSIRKSFKDIKEERNSESRGGRVKVGGRAMKEDMT